jgi:hypothetical protein
VCEMFQKHLLFLSVLCKLCLSNELCASFKCFKNYFLEVMPFQASMLIMKYFEGYM